MTHTTMATAFLNYDHMKIYSIISQSKLVNKHFNMQISVEWSNLMQFNNYSYYNFANFVLCM